MPLTYGVNMNDKTTNFYNSWEWKRVRYDALIKYGAVCMLCGAKEKIVVDHIIPLKVDPLLSLQINNLQVLCNDCNMGKGQRRDDHRVKNDTFLTTRSNLARVQNGFIYQWRGKLGYTTKEHIVKDGKTLCKVENDKFVKLRENSPMMRINKKCKRCLSKNSNNIE